MAWRVYKKYMKGYEGLQSYGKVHKDMERYKEYGWVSIGTEFIDGYQLVQSEGIERY